MWLGITRSKIHDLTNSECWLGFPRVESALSPIRELLLSRNATPHTWGCCAVLVAVVISRHHNWAGLLAAFLPS